MNLYPIKFAPRLVEKIWGGQALASVVGKPLPADKAIGESWELYDFPPGVVEAEAGTNDNAPAWTSARISNGPLAGQTLHELLSSHQKELLGQATPVQTPHGPQFPLLIKFLDARQDLSIQVHPPEAYARAHPGAAVKNECWYVLDHNPAREFSLAPSPARHALRLPNQSETVTAKNSQMRSK